MVEQLDELYRDVILDHFKSSSHAGELPNATITSDGNNPLCGDELTVLIRLEGDRVAQARFKGTGCAISQAAASMLTGQMEGLSIRDVTRLVEAMKGLMQGKDPDASIDLGDLEALAGVRKFPVRIKCAALSWNVVEQGLAQYQSGCLHREGSHDEGSAKGSTG